MARMVSLKPSEARCEKHFSGHAGCGQPRFQGLRTKTMEKVLCGLGPEGEIEGAQRLRLLRMDPLTSLVLRTLVESSRSSVRLCAAALSRT